MFLANSKPAKRKTRLSQNVLISLRVGLCRFVKTATISDTLVTLARQTPDRYIILPRIAKI